MMPLLKKNSNDRMPLDHWSDVYDDAKGMVTFHRFLLDLAVKHSGIKNGDRILDIGCGTGRLGLQFLQKADCVIVNIDNAQPMIDIIEDKRSKLGLNSAFIGQLMDAEAITFDDTSFNLVVSTAALHHLDEKLVPLRKIRRLLKSGGKLIIGEIDMDTTGSHKDVVRMKRILKINDWVYETRPDEFRKLDRATFNRDVFGGAVKHILNKGDFCISFKQWTALCREAGFTRVTVKRCPSRELFGIVIAHK
jgi:ubiquinone/menaquinone biosynthesis C-methylase UbiE